MGNQNSVYKIVVIGMRGAGKSAYCSLLEPIVNSFSTDVFQYFEYEYSKKTTLQFWDLNGKHPHLWSHYTTNANGLIFIVDQLAVDTKKNYV